MSAEYGEFCEFFADEIYSARDFTERNESFRKVTTQFRAIIGDEIFTGLIRLLDLHRLTDELDDKMAVLLEQESLIEVFTEADYEYAYRALDNYGERRTQLEMIVDSLRFTHDVSQRAFIGMVLRSARVAAGIFTKDRILELLDTAYHTLRGIENIEPLTAEVWRRELARLDRIYAPEPVEMAGGM
jgi:hypothetical protein